MIRESQSNGTQEKMLRKIHSALSKSREFLDPKPWQYMTSENFSYAVKAFTDNIVLGKPVRNDARQELSWIFNRLSIFQLDMVIEGFFIRGAISVGDAYVDDIAVFGNALTEAYQGECHIARDPRIILTNSAVLVAKENIQQYSDPPYPPPHFSDILCDSDGQWFLNYLNCVLIAGDDHGPFYDDLASHKEKVEERLNEHRGNPPIWSKYTWVANYHNYFCDMHPQHFDESHKIDVELFRASPKPIIEIAKQSPYYHD